MTKENVDRTSLSDRQAIDALMPWYVAGRLADEDRRSIEARLADDPLLGPSLAAAEAELEAVRAHNEGREQPAPAFELFDRLSKRIDAEGPSHLQRSPLAAILDSLGGMIASLGPRGLALATMTAAIAIMLQAGFIARLLAPPAEIGGLQTASGPQGIPPGAPGAETVLIRFADNASVGDVALFLRQEELVIVDGPRAGGFFHVRISEIPLSTAQRKQRLAELAGHKELIVSIAAGP